MALVSPNCGGQLSSLGFGGTGEASDGDAALNDFYDEVVMAVEAGKKSNIGCCYFSAKEKTLFLMSDVKSGGLEILESRECKSSTTNSTN